MNCPAFSQVSHVVEGDLGAVAKDAVQLTTAGARGAAESVQLAVEILTGVHAGSASHGEGCT